MTWRTVSQSFFRIALGSQRRLRKRLRLQRYNETQRLLFQQVTRLGTLLDDEETHVLFGRRRGSLTPEK